MTYEWHVSFRHVTQGFGKNFRVISAGDTADSYVGAVVAARKELKDAGYDNFLDFEAVEVRRMGIVSR